MRSFEDGASLLSLVPGAVTRELSRADVGRGLEGLHRAQVPGLLHTLALRARVESITASSALEGVIVPDPVRASRILAGRPTTLRTRSEQELAGYRDALDYLWRSSWQPLNTGFVLHLHRLLFGRTAGSVPAERTWTASPASDCS